MISRTFRTLLHLEQTNSKSRHPREQYRTLANDFVHAPLGKISSLAAFRATKEQLSVGLIAVHKQPRQWTTDIKSNIREKSGGEIARHAQQTFSVLPKIKELFKSGENEENAIISPGSRSSESTCLEVANRACVGFFNENYAIRN
ncbi:hypothetical protein TNIN_75361 [Trichonephila inaurata madagascariensis]|uniref:Uncharacterized protein n=1 Tax=Trichonephila inaurata madagascariensis TaxID=2747483 RepID=A0A8X6WY73_9ARAC|nr:hypothetical protein TNIN_75361 [Trichonephila inaurata madagascariensis]